VIGSSGLLIISLHGSRHPAPAPKHPRT
jgi:hypothetical protein